MDRGENPFFIVVLAGSFNSDSLSIEPILESVNNIREDFFTC